MIVGTILTRVRDHLRGELALPADQIEIRIHGHPPASAGPTFIALREQGVKSDGRSFLREEHHIEITLWRRLTDLPEDAAAVALYGDDPVQPDAATLDELERAIIRAVHGNELAFVLALNQSLGLSSGGPGGPFQLPLYYTGRKGTEIVRQSGAPASTWAVRRLQFVGLNRVQSLDALT